MIYCSKVLRNIFFIDDPGSLKIVVALEMHVSVSESVVLIDILCAASDQRCV